MKSKKRDSQNIFFEKYNTLCLFFPIRSCPTKNVDDFYWAEGQPPLETVSKTRPRRDVFDVIIFSFVCNIEYIV